MPSNAPLNFIHATRPQSIVELMTAIPDTKDTSLFHLCEFIEDCEFTDLSTQILHLIGSLGPTTASPARYIRFIYNRVSLCCCSQLFLNGDDTRLPSPESASPVTVELSQRFRTLTPSLTQPPS